MSKAFLRPCNKASYSATLLVHSNSNVQAHNVLLLAGSMMMQPVPTPSLDLEPSKYKDQIQFLSGSYDFWIEAVGCVNALISNCCRGSLIGETSAMKFSK
jgi:hypothetical protein